MDPLSLLGTVLAISQAALAIRASIDKVKGNKKRLENLVNDIVSSLDNLEKFAKAHLKEVDGSPLLISAVSKLQHDISLLLGRCQKLARQSDGGHLSKVKTAVKSWHKRDEIEGELIRIKEAISSCFTQFTAFAAARAENASYRLENSIVVRGAEQQAHLRRLEVLVTNVLLDTGFGKQVVQQMGQTIFAGQKSIENDYLCLQLRTVLDTMEAHPGYRGPVCESSALPFSFQPQFLESVPHDFLVTDVLMLSRTLRMSDVFSIASVAQDLQTLAIKLNDLNFTREACAAQKTATQLFRNLVGGGTDIFLPYVAHSLRNLAVYLRNAGMWREALSASQDSVEAFRIICQTYPDSDFRLMLAMGLTTHGEDLSTAGKQSESLEALAKASALYSELVQESTAGSQYPSFTLLFSGCAACLSYGDALQYEQKYTEAFGAFKQGLTYLSLVSKDSLDKHVLWNTPNRLSLSIPRILMLIYGQQEGAPLSYVEDAVVLYLQLATIDPQRFSSHFLRSLYLLAFICSFGLHKEAQRVTVEHQYIASLQSILNEDSTFSLLDNGASLLGFDSFNPVIKHLQRTGAGLQVIDQAPFIYLSPQTDSALLSPTLAESIHRLVVALAAQRPRRALNAVQRATTDAIALPDTHHYLPIRILEFLRDLGDKFDLPARTQLIPHAQILLEHCRAALPVADVAKAIFFFGHVVIKAGRESEGIAKIEEALFTYRGLLPESPPVLFDFISSLKDFGVILLRSGNPLGALQAFQEIVSLCHQMELDDPQNDSIKSQYVASLLHVCEYLLTTEMHAHAHSIASRVYELVASTCSPMTHSQANLHSILIQCLRLSGRFEQAQHAASDVASALERSNGRRDASEAQLQVYEHLIHCYALQGDREALDTILQTAYTTFKENLTGGDISPTELGLRHDTLAIIAAHYANFDRPENVLPFAKAAVQTSSKVGIRNVAQDMQYLESICGVAAFLWNSGRSDDAVGLLEGIAEAQRCRTAESGPQLDAPPPVRQIVESLPSDDFQEGLRQYMSTVLTDSSPLNRDPGQQPIVELLATVSNIVELVGRASHVKDGGADDKDADSTDGPSDDGDGVLDSGIVSTPPPLYSPPLFVAAESSIGSNPENDCRPQGTEAPSPQTSTIDLSPDSVTITRAAVKVEAHTGHTRQVWSALLKQGVTVFANFLVLVLLLAFFPYLRTVTTSLNDRTFKWLLR